jgi:hypothetical protein
MATNLLIYSTATADLLIAALTVMKANADSGDILALYDITGITTGDLTTAIGADTELGLAHLSANTFDNIYITAPCEADSDTTPTGTINCTQQYLLRAMLKTANQGTASAEVTNATTFTTTTIGDSSLSTTWTANEFIGEHVMLISGTGELQLSEVKSNTTTIATIRGIFHPTPDNTTDFKTIVGMHMYLFGVIHTDLTITKYIAERTWHGLYPNLGHNVLSAALGGNGLFSEHFAGCDSLNATTLTDSDGGFVADALIGKYVQIYSASTNGYQYALITDNSTTVLTFAGWNLGLTPTGTPTYRVVDNLSMVFRDLYVKYFVLTYMWDPTSSIVHGMFKRLVDSTGGNSSLKTPKLARAGVYTVGPAPMGDWDYFAGTVISKGKIMFDALRRSVTA